MRGKDKATLSISQHDGKSRLRYRVELVPASKIQPSPENAELYGEIDFNSDPALPMLRRSIVERGLEEPLILTRDNFILSGHRRFHIVKTLGWQVVPCRCVRLKRSDVKDYHRLLAEYNPQRVKSVAAILAENFLLGDKPETRSQSWADYQKRTCPETTDPVQVSGSKFFKSIGERRAEFLAAAQDVIKALRNYWPLTVRQVHYGLLNNPPLTQVTRGRDERWRYRNDAASYGKLSDLLTLARYCREVPWRAIADATRETREFSGSRNLAEFIEVESRNFLNGYGRHRQEGQPNQVEVVIEKNTLIGLVQGICENLHVPFTPLRGYGGPSVWHELHVRLMKKRKSFPDAKLVLIFVSDHDPEGFDLMDDAVRSLRDKHLIPVEAIRAAVTKEQVKRFHLQSNFAKETSARFKSYVQRTGTNQTWECEALPPEDLRRAVYDSILSALNVEQLGAVQKLETEEQKQLERIRKRIAPAMRKILLGGRI